MHHHPLLASFNLRYALTAVPGLASQTSIPASGVHSMQVRPYGCGRCGCDHLERAGWCQQFPAAARSWVGEPWPL